MIGTVTGQWLWAVLEPAKAKPTMLFEQLFMDLKAGADLSFTVVWPPLMFFTIFALVSLWVQAGGYFVGRNISKDTEEIPGFYAQAVRRASYPVLAFLAFVAVFDAVGVFLAS